MSAAAADPVAFRQLVENSALLKDNCDLAYTKDLTLDGTSVRKELDAEIGSLKPKVIVAMSKTDEPSGSYAEVSSGLLSAMLSRFLWYRQIGEQEKGMEILKKDLRFHDPQIFPVWHTPVIEGKATSANTISISELEARITKSLEQRPLDEWLKEATSAKLD